MHPAGLRAAADWPSPPIRIPASCCSAASAKGRAPAPLLCLLHFLCLHVPPPPLSPPPLPPSESRESCFCTPSTPSPGPAVSAPSQHRTPRLFASATSRRPSRPLDSPSLATGLIYQPPGTRSLLASTPTQIAAAAAGRP
ncbi:hypothetical protein CDD83_4560 [Cordyceps sp. RAO-2017]|nr:hypothetical protein CDD83_4560 [Cordyceps sp. RAO-2017]